MVSNGFLAVNNSGIAIVLFICVQYTHCKATEKKHPVNQDVELFYAA